MTEIILIVLVIIAVLLIVIATRPNTYRVTRSAVIDAPPEKVFPLINDFRRWEAWSPWEKLDPALQRRFSGPEAGKGAVYEWQGNKKVGQGRMEIVDSFAPSKALIKLDFLKPFKSSNMTEFTLEPRDKATEVTWEMYGPSPFMTKAISLFGGGMDKLVGKDFERGLANLRAAAEGRAPEAVPPPR